MVKTRKTKGLGVKLSGSFIDVRRAVWAVFTRSAAFGLFLGQACNGAAWDQPCVQAWGVVLDRWREGAILLL